MNLFPQTQSVFRRVCMAAVLGAAALGAQAEDKVDIRQANQQERIDAGVTSGELTQREQKRLERDQKRIARAEGRAESDGVVTRKESARLAVGQRKTSRQIAHAKNDRQKLPQ